MYTVAVGMTWSFKPEVFDADGDAVTFSVRGQPDWMTFNEVTGELKGTPVAGNVGETEDIQIDVTDARDAMVSVAFKIGVEAAPAPPSSTPPTTPTPTPSNTAPTISGTPSTLVQALQSYIFIPTASDKEGDTLRFSITNKPSWITFNTGTGQLSGTPSRTQATTYSNIRISVSDGKTTASLNPFNITVQPAPLNLSGTPTTSVTAGTAYSFRPSVTNAGGATLTWSIANKPTWASFQHVEQERSSARRRRSRSARTRTSSSR